MTIRSSREIAIIVAHDQNRLIGATQQLPWHLPADLKRFKKLTLGHKVIMGRTTFESIGKPLPGRLNVVISRTLTSRSMQSPTNLVIVPSLEQALDYPVTDIKYDGQALHINPNRLFIIGGQQIYQQSLDICDKLYLTLIKGNFSGDTYFPDYDLKDWKLVESEPGKYEDLDYTFLVYERLHN